MTLETLIASANELRAIPDSHADAYRHHATGMVSKINQLLDRHPDKNLFLGPNTSDLLEDNHSNHADFMATVFSIGNFELLARMLPWVYRAYTSRGVDPNYFTFELRSWIDQVSSALLPDATASIVPVYEWMLMHHDDVLELASEPPPPGMDDQSVLKLKSQDLLHCLLEGDKQGSVKIMEDALRENHTIDMIYVHVVEEAMAEIGRLWEKNVISVSQEHLASAIVGQALALLETPHWQELTFKGKAIVTAAPNEFHEIGAWMVYDVLESEGWDVRYFGANTAARTLIELMDSFHPDLIAISITMPFNILKGKAMIEEIRSADPDRKVTIAVGGRAFHDQPDLWLTTGADVFAPDVNTFKGILDEVA